jgi:hypothetical protein
MFKALQPVTICDQFCFFCFGKAKHKIRRKSLFVSGYSLIQYLCGYGVQFSQVCIYQYFSAPDPMDRRFDPRNRDQYLFSFSVILWSSTTLQKSFF